VWAPSLGDGTWIGYEDPESLARKVDYVKERGLRGVMFWELSGDQRSGPTTLLGTPLPHALDCWMAMATPWRGARRRRPTDSRRPCPRRSCRTGASGIASNAWPVALRP